MMLTEDTDRSLGHAYLRAIPLLGLLVIVALVGSCQPVSAQVYDLDVFDVWGEEILRGDFEIEKDMASSTPEIDIFQISGEEVPCMRPEDLRARNAEMGLNLVGPPMFGTGPNGVVVVLFYANDPDVGYGEVWVDEMEGEVCLLLLGQPSTL